jgi:Phytanoyl-CoA dioxygenase (PhyH)
MSESPIGAGRTHQEGDLGTLGYIIHRQVVAGRACDLVAVAAHRVICENREGDVPSSSQAGRLWQPHLRPEWAEITQQALEVFVANGGRASLELSQLQIRVTGGEGEPWHQDAAFFDPQSNLAYVMWIALTRLTGDSGLRVQPGSHADPIHVHRDLPVQGSQGRKAIEGLPGRSSVAVDLDPGDVLVFLPNLVHCVNANRQHDYTAAIVGYLTMN